jgi:hypothetical protein
MAENSEDVKRIVLSMIAAGGTDLYGLGKDNIVYRYGPKEEMWIPLPMVTPKTSRRGLKYTLHLEDLGRESKD